MRFRWKAVETHEGLDSLNLTSYKPGSDGS